MEKERAEFPPTLAEYIGLFMVKNTRSRDKKLPDHKKNNWQDYAFIMDSTRDFRVTFLFC